MVDEWRLREMPPVCCSYKLLLVADTRSPLNDVVVVAVLSSLEPPPVVATHSMMTLMVRRQLLPVSIVVLGLFLLVRKVMN